MAATTTMVMSSAIQLNVVREMPRSDQIAVRKAIATGTLALVATQTRVSLVGAQERCRWPRYEPARLQRAV